MVIEQILLELKPDTVNKIVEKEPSRWDTVTSSRVSVYIGNLVAV
jgi:hypothetical protein